MEVWSGEIILEDGSNVPDIQLNSTTGEAIAIPKSAKLHYLSQVEVAGIPLILVVGPSYHVSTSNSFAEQWLSSILLQEHPSTAEMNKSWFDFSTESFAGILVRVEYKNHEFSESHVTELMIYGMCQASAAEVNTLAWKVMAVPLSSSRLKEAEKGPVHPTSTVNDGLVKEDTARIETTASHRDIFDTANELRRKAAGRGGAGIQAAAAGQSQARMLVGQKKQKSKSATGGSLLRPEGENAASLSMTSPALSHMKPSLRRSPSISSSVNDHSRKKSTDGNSAQMAAVGSQPLSSDEKLLEQSNKEAISRLIMAGMRLYGFQSRKRTDTEDREQQSDTQQADLDSEYKHIYHQTYKASIFAFVSQKLKICFLCGCVLNLIATTNSNYSLKPACRICSRSR